MLLIALKFFLAVTLMAIGLWFWRLADRWNEKGEIPKEWVESLNPRSVLRSEKGFGSTVIWQRVMAVLFLVFAFLLALSIIFQIFGII